MSACLRVCLPACLPACLLACLPACRPACWPACPSTACISVLMATITCSHYNKRAAVVEPPGQPSLTLGQRAEHSPGSTKWRKPTKRRWSTRPWLSPVLFCPCVVFAASNPADVLLRRSSTHVEIPHYFAATPRLATVTQVTFFDA